MWDCRWLLQTSIYWKPTNLQGHTTSSGFHSNANKGPPCYFIILYSFKKRKKKKSLTWFSLRETHLHILECQVFSAAPSVDRKMGSSTCHHAENSHNSFHSRIYVQIDVIAEKNSSRSDTTSTIWLYKIALKKKKTQKTHPSNDVLRLLPSEISYEGT